MIWWGGGGNQCLLTFPRTYEWCQMYEIIILSKHNSHKNWIKFNNVTPDYGPNLIYPLVVLKFDPKEPKLFLKSQNLLKISSKMHFILLIILSALENGKKLYRFDWISNIAYIANKSWFSYLAAILDAILDFSARHHLCQFMPAVSYTTDYTKHFDI